MDIVDKLIQEKTELDKQYNILKKEIFDLLQKINVLESNTEELIAPQLDNSQDKYYPPKKHDENLLKN